MVKENKFDFAINELEKVRKEVVELFYEYSGKIYLPDIEVLIADRMLKLKKEKSLREITKFKIAKGWTVFEMNFMDVVMIFNGYGICDECGDSTNKGYYVPVLNHYQCPKCYEDWKSSCEFYEEDLWFEKDNIKFVEERIKKLSSK